MRQKERLVRLQEAGLRQANVIVHDENRPGFEKLRPHLSDPDLAPTLDAWISSISQSGPVNVAQVRHLSPLRYPGGKTWLVPVTRQWLSHMRKPPKVLLEPFAGGAIVSLSAVAEGLVERAELVELDDDVAALWECLIHATEADMEKLYDRILRFKVTLENVREVIDGRPRMVHTRAFRTIVKNRCQRGGILAPGAGLVKTGESGRGLASRWYPETLVTRMKAIRQLRERLGFTHGDAFEAIEQNPGATLFLDPPYTAGGKRAGSRLYKHNELDHRRLFDLTAAHDGAALLTYDDSKEARDLAAEFGFLTGDVAMKNTHHVVMRELTIFKDQP